MLVNWEDGRLYHHTQQIQQIPANISYKEIIGSTGEINLLLRHPIGIKINHWVEVQQQFSDIVYQLLTLAIAITSAKDQLLIEHIISWLLVIPIVF